MSLAKSIAAFIVYTLFVISLYFAVSSYTMGDFIQKENIKGFVETQTTGELVSGTCEDLCKSESDTLDCDEYCSYLDVELREECRIGCQRNISQDVAKQNCVQMCISKANETQGDIYKTVDDVYAQEIGYGITLNDITSLFRNTILFIASSIVFGILIFFVADKPLTKLGNKLVLVSIFLLSMAVIPLFIITPDIPIIKLVTDYIMKGFEKQIIVGIVLMVIGIIFIIIGKKVKLKKGSKEKVEKKVEKKIEKKSVKKKK